MRVVLDSNLLFSFLIKPAGPIGGIIRAWRHGRFQLITSRHQVEEIRDASHRLKFKGDFRPAQVGEMINRLRRGAVVLERLSINHEVDDPDDSYLLAMTLAGEADYLVTGDHHAGLLKMKRFGRTRIVTPTQFYRLIR